MGSSLWTVLLFSFSKEDFPGGTVGKNPSASAGDTGSIPGQGRFHTPLGGN